MTFIELKNFFKKRFGIERHADIAKKLNVSAQTVNNWKTRNQVPSRIYLEVIEKYKLLAKVDSKNVDIKSPYFSKESLTELEESYIFQENFFSLSKLIGTFQKKIKIILIITSIFSLFSIFYVQFIAKSVYSSTTLIVPAKNENSTNSFSGVAAQLGIMSSPISDTKLLYPEIIKSRTIAKKVLKRKFYSDKYGENKLLLNIIINSDDDFETRLSKGADAFISSINVKDKIKSGIVEINVESSEPVLVAEILEALIEEVDNHQKSFKKKQAKKKRKFIEERIEVVSIDLMQAEDKLKTFRTQNRKYIDSPALLLEFERLMRETEVQKQLYITLKQEFELAQIEEVEDDDILYIIDQPEIPLYSSSPKKKSFVILSFMFGLGLSLLTSILIEKIEDKDSVLL